jgi:hypothetical protein
MKPQRTWNPAGADKENAEIELLYLELAAFNQRIVDLEKLHPDGPKIEILKASALLVSRQIDELREVILSMARMALRSLDLRTRKGSSRAALSCARDAQARRPRFGPAHHRALVGPFHRMPLRELLQNWR